MDRPYKGKKPNNTEINEKQIQSTLGWFCHVCEVLVVLDAQ